jgi:hypothetical protein
MSALRDWARLDARWYEDPVLRAAAKQAPGAFVMWPVLVAMAKAHSHAIDNPFGRIMISVEDLAAACRVTKKRADAALVSLADAELVSVVADKSDIVCISLNGFEKWQTPRKSKADNKANADFKKCRENVPLSGGVVVERLPSGGGVVAPDIDLDVDVDKLPPINSAQAPVDDDDSDLEVEIPKTSPRDIGVQIKQARGRLGSLTLSVETIIANSQADRDEPFTDRELVRLFYKPACELLAEVGHSRMRAALGTAIENGASRIQYAATVARSEHRKSDVRAKAEKAANGVPEIGRKPSEDELRAAGLLPPIEGVA